MLSPVQLFATPWTEAHQAPQSMGFPRQEYWSGLSFPPPGHFPDPGIKPKCLASLSLTGGFFTTWAIWEALCRCLLLLLLSRFSRVWPCATPETAAHQAPRPWDSPGKNTGVGCHFLLQCMKVKSEKWKWSRSVVSDSSRFHGLQPTRLLHPWDFPGKSTGVGCHCLLRCRCLGRNN